MCSVFLNMWLFPEFWVLRSVIPGSSRGLGFLGMITGLSGVFPFLKPWEQTKKPAPVFGVFVQSLVWLGCLGMLLTFLLLCWVDMPSPDVRQAVSLLEEVVTPRKDLPPLLLKLNERPAEHLDYLGVSYGLTPRLLK